MSAAEAATSTVRLGRTTLEAIRREAGRAYPNEGCGALLGPATGEVEEALPLPNTEEQAPRTRFVVSARDYIAVEDEADARCLMFLGFWPSPPAPPPAPPSTDPRSAWYWMLTSVSSRQLR